MTFRLCPQCNRSVTSNNFVMNFCNECDMQSNGFSRASLDQLKDFQERQRKHELMLQAINEAYDSSESHQEKLRLEAERVYLEAHPPMLNEKYEDIRRKIPKYSEIED